MKNYRLEFNTLLTQTQEQLDSKLATYQSQASEIAEQKEQLDAALTRFGDCFSNMDIKLTQLEQELLGQNNTLTKYKNNEFLPLQRRVEEVEQQQITTTSQLGILHALREDVQSQYDTQLVHNSKLVLLEQEVSQLTEMMQTNTSNFALLSEQMGLLPNQWEARIAEVSRTMQEFHQTYQQSQEILTKSQKKLKTKVNDIITNLQHLSEMKTTMTTLIQELENRFVDEIAHSYDFQSTLQRNTDLLQHLENRMEVVERSANETIQRQYEEVKDVQQKELQKGLQLLQTTMEKRVAMAKDALDYRLQSVLTDKEGLIEKVSQANQKLQQEIAEFKREQEESQSNWTTQLLKEQQVLFQSHREAIHRDQQEWKEYQSQVMDEKLIVLSTDVKSLAETISFFNQAFASMESQIHMIESNHHHSEEQFQGWQRELGSLQREVRLQEEILRRSLASFEEVTKERELKEERDRKEHKKHKKHSDHKKQKHFHDYRDEHYSDSESDSESERSSYHSSESESDHDDNDDPHHEYPKKHHSSSPIYHDRKTSYRRDSKEHHKSNSRRSHDRKDENVEEDRHRHSHQRKSHDSSNQLRSRHNQEEDSRKRSKGRRRYENEEEEPHNHRYRKRRDDDDDNDDHFHRDHRYSPDRPRHSRDSNRSSRDHHDSPKNETSRTSKEEARSDRSEPTKSEHRSIDRTDMPPKPPNLKKDSKPSSPVENKDHSQKPASKTSSPKNEEWLGINSDLSSQDSRRRRGNNHDRQEKIPDRSHGSDSHRVTPTQQPADTIERVEEIHSSEQEEEGGGEDSEEDDNRYHAIDPHPPPTIDYPTHDSNNSEEYIQTPSPTDIHSHQHRPRDRDSSEEMVLIAPSTADRTGLDSSQLISEPEEVNEEEEEEEKEVTEDYIPRDDEEDEEEDHPVAPTYSTSPTQKYSPNTLLVQRAKTNRANVPGGMLKTMPPRPPTTSHHPTSLQFPAEIRRSETDYSNTDQRRGITDHSLSENLLNQSSTTTINNYLPSYETYPPTYSSTMTAAPLLETSLVTSSTSPLNSTVLASTALPLTTSEVVEEVVVTEEESENDFRKVHELMDSTYSSIVALDLKSIKSQSFEDFYHDPTIVRSPPRVISSSTSEIFTTLQQTEAEVLSTQQQKNQQHSTVSSMFPEVETIEEGEELVSPSLAIASDASIMDIEDKREDETIVTSDSQILRDEGLQSPNNNSSNSNKIRQSLVPSNVLDAASSPLPPLSRTSSTTSSSTERKRHDLSSSSSNPSTASSSPNNASSPSSPPHFYLNDLATISMKDLNNSLEYYDREEDPFMLELQRAGLSPSNPDDNENNNNNNREEGEEEEEEEDSASDDSLDHLPKYSPKDLNQMRQTEILEHEETDSGRIHTMEGLDILSEFESLLNRSNRSHASPAQQLREQVEAIEIPPDAFDEEEEENSQGGSQRSFQQEVVAVNDLTSTPITTSRRPPLPASTSAATGDRSSFLLLEDYDQEVEEIKEYLSSDLLLGVGGGFGGGGGTSVSSSIDLEERRKAEIVAEKKKKYRSQFIARLKKK